nr:inverted formin-2-like [Aegilops tauschii subsp. strangulata]
MASTGPSVAASAVPPTAPSGAAQLSYGAAAAYGAPGVTHMQLAPSGAASPPYGMPGVTHMQLAMLCPPRLGFSGLPVGGYGPPIPVPPYGGLPPSPSLGGYGPPALAPPYEGLPPPPVPVPWDPTLLAAQHSAASPSSSVGGGDLRP